MMTDKGALVLLAASPTAAAGAWLTHANSWATFGVTIVTFVSISLASLYYYERWRTLRKERQDKQEKQ